MLLKVREKKPKFGSHCFIAPSAQLIGDVSLGNNCSVWFNTTLRGDVAPIVIADECNIQDGTTIHGTFDRCGVVLEKRVTIGHNVMLHGCTVGEGSLIGMGSIVMDLARIGSHCLVAAGSLVTEESRFEDAWLILGRPAKAIRRLNKDELKSLEESADNYLLYKSWYQ